MAKRGRRKVKKRQSRYILEQTSILEIQKSKRAMEALIRHQWNFYSELAYQRTQIDAQLKDALNQNCTSDYEFKGWQRAVKYRYGLHPLCTNGSVFDPGGRFNIGDIAPQNFPVFPALYIAEDKDTALQEALGQAPPPAGSELTARELALTNPQSETIVAVSGQLERVFDLTLPNVLDDFVELIKDFKVSDTLKAEAARLNRQVPRIARSTTELLKVLLDPNWRMSPTQVDIPAGSQVFGQLIYSAGIEGVVYPSKLTGKKCLATFPRNFESTSSFLQIDDAPPLPNVPTRIDSTNPGACELSAEDALALLPGKN